MKRIFLTLTLTLLSVVSMMAMSDARIRETARFLTDRMAYELQLTPAQYEDCFEVNYDFIASANGLMDDVVYGYSDAIDSYYDYLDYRNEDLRYILNATQYGLFIGLDYFFRPIYTTARRWAFRIYDVYHNHNYYYYGLPVCYHSYHGLHSHIHYHNGFYMNRYRHPHYHTPAPIHHGNAYESHRRNDFGDRYHHRDNGHGNLHFGPNGNGNHRHGVGRDNDHRNNRGGQQGNHHDNDHKGSLGHQQGNADHHRSQGHQQGNEKNTPSRIGHSRSGAESVQHPQREVHTNHSTREMKSNRTESAPSRQHSTTQSRSERADRHSHGSSRGNSSSSTRGGNHSSRERIAGGRR